MRIMALSTGASLLALISYPIVWEPLLTLHAQIAAWSTGYMAFAALAGLSAGRGAEGFREFVMRDVDGNVDKIRVDLTANPSLLDALNTTAGRHTPEAVGMQVA